MKMTFEEAVKVFPACAGVILVRSLLTLLLPSFPRMRGGDPELSVIKDLGLLFSPHARG